MPFEGRMGGALALNSISLFHSRAKIKNQEKAAAAAADAKKEAEKNGLTSQDEADAVGHAPAAGGLKASPPTPLNLSAGGLTPTNGSVAPPTPTDPSKTPVPHNPGTPNALPPPMQPPASISPRPASSDQSNKPSLLLPGGGRLDMNRRVSLAGGDVASVEHWVRQRKQQMGHTPPQASVSASNSPMGLAAAARRNSQPYPTQIITSHIPDDPNAAALSRSALPSPKVSPNGRMPGALLFTAMRNNTIRRASMPGGAQLISTTAFTPPRVPSFNHPVSSSQPQSRILARELSPIKDQDTEIDPSLRGGVPMTYVTPPPSAYPSDGSYLSVPSSTESAFMYSLNPGLPFAPNSPLPNPSFSFGGTPTSDVPAAPIHNHVGGGMGMDQAGTSPVNADKDPQHALYLALQRGRLGSLASVNSVATNGTDGGSTEGGSDAEWPPFVPPGFDPDIRRASAPADLLHNIGLLGISSNSAVQPMAQVRPSPLAPYSSQNAVDHVNSYELSLPPHQGSHSAGPVMSNSSSTPTLAGGPYIPAANESPVQSSAVTSEGPSPGGAHPSISHSLMPPPPLPSNSNTNTHNRHSLYSFSEVQQYSSLPSQFPSVPDPSVYTSLSGLPSSSADGSFPSEFDLGFDLNDNEDKDQYAFLAELTNDNTSDTVNVLV